MEEKKAVREYVAFISYRHTELDKKVAKKVHYMVEHYIIPKELRKNGAKKLGKVGFGRGDRRDPPPRLA